MESNMFNGIKLHNYYKPNNVKWTYCDVLDIDIDLHFLRKGGFLKPFYILSEISIMIYDKLGFDLSNKEALEISFEIQNKNKVINVWNNLVNEFNDYKVIKEKLSDESFQLDKYLEGYSVLDKKKYVPKKAIINLVIEEEEVEEMPNELESDLLEEESMFFIGNTKQIELSEDKLIIGPNTDTWGGKLRAASGTTSVDIYYSDIRSVIVQQQNIVGAFFNNGSLTDIANTFPYIRILIKGTESYSNGNFSPIDDPYTVTFTADKFGLAENFKLQIDKFVSKHRRTNNGFNVINQISSADELEKFANLLQKGIITQDEFNLKKKQILGL